MQHHVNDNGVHPKVLSDGNTGIPKINSMLGDGILPQTFCLFQHRRGIVQSVDFVEKWRKFGKKLPLPGPISMTAELASVFWALATKSRAAGAYSS